MAKKYTSNDFGAVSEIATALKLKYWRLESPYGAILKKCNAMNNANQLQEVFNYLNSDFVEDGEYYIIGKTGHQSKAETKLRIEKGNRDPKAGPANTSIINYQYPENYERLVKENAELRADKYYLEELIRQKDEKIKDLIEELNEEPVNSFNWQDVVKEYTPAAFELINKILIKPSPVPSFADPVPVASVPKLTRFSPEYYQFLRENISNSALISQELEYIQTNKPDKVNEWQTVIFS